jgi:tRNA(His) 5'-end guanylyltransferase
MNALQLLCMNKHYDKRPANALIAKAVELCVEKGVSYLVYGRYVYAGNTKSSLTEFKRRNGFEQILIPTYYIPLTFKGRVFMKLGLHLGLKRLLPERILSMFRELRSNIYERSILGKHPSAASASATADPKAEA